MDCDEALRSLRATREAFASRFYRWSAAQTELEAASGLPTAESVKASEVFLFQDFAATIAPAELATLLRGNLKAWQPEGAALCGETITTAERELRQRFKDYHRQEVTVGARSVVSARVSPRELALRNDPARVRIKKSVLKTELKRSLRDVLGAPEKLPGAGLRYCQPFGPWFLFSSFDLSGQAQLYVSHQVGARPTIDGCPTFLQQSISPLSWCGIHSETAFDLLGPDELGAAADFLADHVRRLTEALPGLLLGLSHSVLEILRPG